MSEKLKKLIFELVDALEQMASDHYAEDFLKVMTGLHDDSFFTQAPEVQKEKIIWVNAAYFGRGEIARPLIEKGFLRRSFSKDFQKEVDKIA